MRNEKVVLVVLAYIIGFNTAFIAFGLSTEYALEKSVVYIPTPSAAATETIDNVETPTQSTDVVQILEESEGLYALVGNQKKALTARVEAVSEPRDGAYVSVPLYSVSPDGAYIHFCEQQITSDPTCKHFIYNVDRHVLHRVKVAGTQYISSLTSVNGAWSPEGNLTVDSFSSTNITEPWVLQ